MPRTITVTGHGSAAAVPDTAVVDVAVAHRAPVLADAVAAVDSDAVALVRLAKGLAGSTRVASTGLQVWPAHDAQGRQEGFEASHRFRLGCPGLPTASALVTGLVAEVGDSLRIEGVTLEVGDPGAAQRSAREAAYDDARERAGHLAGLVGAALGDVLEVVEGDGHGRGSPEGTAMAGLAFEPGESLVGGRVTVTWQLV